MIKMKKFYVTAILLYLGCSGTNEYVNFRPNDQVETIVRCDQKWTDAVQKGDSNIIADIYDRDAHYVPDGFKALHGNKEIIRYWYESFAVIKDIRLYLESLEGNRDLLYETGTGYSLLVNPKDNRKLDTFRFKYVNVWKRQPDDRYKVVVDTYNDIPGGRE